ncbi:Zonadhesin [Dactylellina cionopaga]|nr:Zonadhesin [Dactylellina cionopaga]
MTAGKGTYTFKWTSPAEEVFVTGSFDNWTKSAKLVKAADGTHLDSVEVPLDKVTYKFVVDGTWTVDPKQRVEKDASGNDNNYLTLEDISPNEEPTFHAPEPIPDTAAHDNDVSPFLHSVGPTSTTAALAAAVPLEPKAERALEPEPESVAVPDAKAEEPEEPVVATISSVGPEATTAALAAQVPLEENVKEEPTVATISSVGPEATTAALAAEVPLEEKLKEEPIVPEATKALAAPEDLPTPDPKTVPGFLPDTVDAEEPTFSVNPFPASETAGNPIHLEPNEPVPVPTGSVTDNVKLDEESYNHPDASNLGVGATATAALAAVTGAITSAVGSVTGGSGEHGTTGGGITEAIKNLIPESALPIIMRKPEEDHTTATTETVPPVVTESQTKAEVEPEASAYPEAVEHKKEVEEQLIEKTVLAAPEPVITEAKSAEVPEIVRESQVEASAPFEASASPIAVEAKKEIEAELKSEVKPTEPIAEVPTSKPSEPEAVPAIVVASIEKAGTSTEAAANPVAVEAKTAVESEISKGETKPEPLEPPKTEEPSTVEKAAETATTTAEKATETAAATAEKVADKVAPEDTKTTEAKPAKQASTASPKDDKEIKKKRRISGWFKKLTAKLK